MITLKSQREIDLMAKSGELLASIHRGLRDLIKPGIDMWDIEEYVRKRCKEANALPLQIGVEGSIMDYPYATCCSLNDGQGKSWQDHIGHPCYHRSCDKDDNKSKTKDNTSPLPQLLRREYP